MAEFCTDDELAYERSRARFESGVPFTLDETYCLAHLPLVDPAHPRGMARKEGTYYEHGQHPRVYSLVLPVPQEALDGSPSYRQLEAELRDEPFASKIAWPLVEQRRHKLHATICGSLSTGERPEISPEIRQQLSGLGPVAVEVRGLFSGNVNRGRLYLRVYPERWAGANGFHLIQRAMRHSTTDLYVVGIWNLVDDLNAVEAQALRRTVERWCIVRSYSSRWNASGCWERAMISC